MLIARINTFMVMVEDKYIIQESQDLFHLVLIGAKLSILGLTGDDANTTPVKIRFREAVR